MSWRASLVASLVGLGVLLGVPLALALPRTDGHLVCALDDPFIHMAIARNLVENGVWGVSPGEFSSSSSSPLWTLLLAGWFAAFGLQEAAPVLLDAGLAVVLVIVLQRLLWRDLGPRAGLYGLAATLAVLALAPLPALVFTGQEHVLQTLCTLGIAATAARLLARPPGAPAAEARWLCLLAPLSLATRYEGAALVLCVCALLVLRRRARLSLAVGLLALVPVVAFGLFARAHDAPFLPNSILVKVGGGDPSLLDRLGGTALANLLRTRHLLALVLASAGLFLARLRRAGFWEERQVVAVLFVAATLAHLQFGRTGWFFRYEAYLVALGTWHLAVSAAPFVLGARSRARALAAVAALGLVALPLVTRAARAFRQVHRASTNIYEQQVQMGRFLRLHYAGETVALNDIGAPTFLGDIRCLDLVGLANDQVAERMRAGTYSTADVERIARAEGARIAIVYESWFERFGGVPASWSLAGRWTIPDNVVCGDDTVAFFAVEPGALGELVEDLRAFDAELPARVVGHGPYRD